MTGNDGSVAAAKGGNIVKTRDFRCAVVYNLTNEYKRGACRPWGGTVCTDDNDRTASNAMKTPTADTPETSAPTIAPRFAGMFAFFARLSSTKFNAQMGLLLDVGVSLALLAAGLRSNTFGIPTAILTVAAGLFVFSLVEYVFHRWLFHGYPNPTRDGHDKHHDDPHGYDALPFFLPPLGVLALAALFALFAPWSIALLLSGALAAGYATYGISHTIIHATRFRARIAVRWAANHHIHHNHPECNFGVTSPLWDIVLGTRYVPARSRNQRTAR
jgi:sterol desaturase/sphingolipid hydroxylase (fatty acid hydroxylase superfamily)